MRSTRRRLLRRGAAVVSTGGMAAVAGCSGQSDDPDPTGEVPWYATWMPTREGVRLDDLPLTDNYEFLTVEPKALIEQRDALPEQTARLLDAPIRLGFGKIKSFRRVLKLPGGTVLIGPYDRTQVTDNVKQSGASESGSKGGYTLYAGDEDGRAAAFAEEKAILSGQMGIENDRLPVVKTIIDAKAGNATRYHEKDPSVKKLVTAIGDTDIVQGLTYGPDEGISGAVASALGVDIGASTTDLQIPVVFSPGEAKTGPVTTWAESAKLVSKADPNVSQSGDVVLVTGSLPTGEVTTLETEFIDDGVPNP